jgi:hypothetical protein
MRRIVMLAVLGAAGCSNAPIAGFLDTVAPCKAGRDDPMQRRPQPGVNISPTDLPPAARPNEPSNLPPPASVVPPVGPG